MSHLVETMFSVKETPWHQRGRIIADAPSYDEVLPHAELDWTVSTVPLYLGEEFGRKPVAKRAIIRDSDKSVLGYCTNRWHGFQNKDMLEFFRPFYDSGLVEFETAGSLKGGQKVWILARIKSDPIEVMPGDTVNKYLMFSNGHDGLTGIRVGFCPIRVVCANTLAAANVAAESRMLRVWHSSRAKDAVQGIQDVLNLSERAFRATEEQYKRLASLPLSVNDLNRFVDVVWYNGIAPKADTRQKTERDNKVNTMLRLLETGRGTDIAGVKGTKWGLYNAATEFLNYEAGRNVDNRLDSLWYGQNKLVSQKAMAYLLAA